MLTVVEKKGDWRRTVKFIRSTPSSEVAVYEARGPGPLKIQVSQEGDYKPGFFEDVKKRFVGNWWTAEDSREKEAKSAAVASSPM
jgi:hypothetical protein